MLSRAETATVEEHGSVENALLRGDVEAWRAITAECAQREIGYSARPLRIARHVYDALPSDVKAILQGADHAESK